MKVKTTLIVLFFLYSLQTIAQSNLIACYPLNNNPNDYSGHNNNGTAYNLTPDTDRFGNINHAYYFSGINSGILINDSVFHLNSFTYSAWCKLPILPVLGDYFSLIAIGGVVADQSILVGNNPGIGHIGFGFGSWDTITTPHHCYQGFLPNANQWYHVVITRDNDSLKLYIDNNFICFQTTGNAAGYLGPILSFTIGTRIDTLSQNFIGSIDEIKIFDKALTYAEILSINSACESSINAINYNSENIFISVYPNPVRSYFVLRGTTAKNDLFLFDSFGNEIIRQKTSDSETLIHTENLLPGIYFIRYLEGIKSVNTKIIKL